MAAGMEAGCVTLRSRYDEFSYFRCARCFAETMHALDGCTCLFVCLECGTERIEE